MSETAETIAIAVGTELSASQKQQFNLSRFKILKYNDQLIKQTENFIRGYLPFKFCYILCEFFQLKFSFFVFDT